MNVPHSLATRQNFSVSMTPMIDVVFLLLIFFVCTASFQLPESVLLTPISPGQTAAVVPTELEEIELERILVEIFLFDGQTQITINDQRCDSMQQLADLLVALATLDSSLPVILAIDGKVPLGSAIEVVDQCRLAGFGKIQFAAEALQ